MKTLFSFLKDKKPLYSSQLFNLIAVVLLGYFLGKSLVGSNYLILLGYFSLFFFAIISKNEKIGIVVVMIFSFYWYFVIRLLSIPSIFTNLIYVMIILLMLRRIFFISIHRAFLLSAPINNPIFAVLAFVLASAVLSPNPLHVELKGIISHTTYIFLFFVVANSDLTELNIKKMVYGILAIAFAQIPASVVQYFFLYSHLPHHYRTDASGGLLGPNTGGINAVFMTYIFSIMYGLMTTYGLKIRYLLASVMLIVPVILSSARAGLAFFILTGLFLSTLVTSIQGRKRVRSMLTGLFIAMCILAAILIIAPSSEIGFLLNTSETYEYSMRKKAHGLGRLRAIGFVHDAISRKIITTIFGLGPGSITPVSTLGEATEYRKSHIDILTHYWSYTYHTIELGYGGLLVYLYLFYKIFSFSMMFSKKIHDPFWSAISIGLSGIIFTSVYSIMYTTSWIYPSLPFCVWFLSGALYRIAYVRGISMKD